MAEILDISHVRLGDRPLPSVFIDDMAHNLHSVRDHVSGCLVLHMMPDSPLHLLAPRPDDGIVRATDWPHAAELIRAHIERTHGYSIGPKIGIDFRKARCVDSKS